MYLSVRKDMWSVEMVCVCVCGYVNLSVLRDVDEIMPLVANSRESV